MAGRKVIYVLLHDSIFIKPLGTQTTSVLDPLVKPLGIEMETGPYGVECSIKGFKFVVPYATIKMFQYAPE